MLLSDYDFVIIHVPGSTNHIADALGRRNDYQVTENHFEQALEQILLPPEKFKINSILPKSLSLHNHQLVNNSMKGAQEPLATSILKEAEKPIEANNAVQEAQEFEETTNLSTTIKEIVKKKRM
ncbi:hypothetical protein SeLEV6574_g04754 [Synchytrium endobioticum]|uniref:Uncharacterized protein n=1 Tax=Synchytrium endobioticum TaxID=286115 RepID=A0A507CXZ1_9FUNG|nr:hypothetical protein SeLEV6574_g04754 [Synchytrium endobioticum]